MTSLSEGMMLYNLDELTQGTAFEAEYDKAISEGLDHAAAVARASGVVEEMTPEKVLRYAVIYKNHLAEGEAIKAEAAKLAERAKIKFNKADALKERLQMLLPPDFSLERPQAVVKFRKLAPSMMITDPSLIPEIYLRIVPESKVPDKDSILRELKTNTPVPGAILAPEKFNVQIK